jgi:hypothetical protein
MYPSRVGQQSQEDQDLFLLGVVRHQLAAVVMCAWKLGLAAVELGVLLEFVLAQHLRQTVQGVAW